MDLQLDGKRALVTGSSSGLGEEIAGLLATEGAAVVVHGRDEERTNAVAKSLRAAGGTASVAIGDLGTDAGADAVVAAALHDGPIDILVNNAGAYDPSVGWADTPPAEWADIYNVNVISSVRLIQRLVPAMRERGWGRVIQIGSAAGFQPGANQPHYAATNAARSNLTLSLARDLKHSGVTSNTVAAGGILVPAVVELMTGLARQYDWGKTWEEIEPNAVAALAPNAVGRLGKTHEYASIVAYLASPLADFVTGATLRIDGGTYDR